MDVSANKGDPGGAYVVGVEPGGAYVVGVEPGDAYVVGVDFGTLSARALVVRVSDGAEAGTAVREYAHGVIDRSLTGHGELPPDWALQDPGNWIEGLNVGVPAAIRDAGIDPRQVI